MQSWHYFSQFFPIIFFWRKLYSFPFIFICKRFNFCYSLRTFSFLFLHDLMYWKHLYFSLIRFIVGSLFLIQSGEPIYDLPQFQKKKKLLKNLLLRLSVLTRKVPGKQKNFQKLSNREIYIILQSKSTTYTKPFMPISWSNFIEEHHKFSSDIWDKIFTNWFTKCSDG